MLTTYDEILKELKQDIAQGIDLEDIRERSYEYVDHYVPIYNNQILEEWQTMPSEYDNRGALELGHNCETINIVNLMQADLYIYYTELTNRVIGDLDQEIQE